MRGKSSRGTTSRTKMGRSYGDETHVRRTQTKKKKKKSKGGGRVPLAESLGQQEKRGERQVDVSWGMSTNEKKKWGSWKLPEKKKKGGKV